MTVWVIAGLLALATGLRIGWSLVNKQSVVSTAMMVALGSLALVAALNWQPLALLIDAVLRWPNVSFALMQIALTSCAAGSCVMITTVASTRPAAATRRLAVTQYSVAAVISAVSLALFFAGGQQPEMSPAEYVRRNVDAPHTSLGWLVPLLYTVVALTVVLWLGARLCSPTRRGRALFLFTVGIALIVAVCALVVVRSLGGVRPISVGAAFTQFGIAMVVVAVGSLLPTIEDYVGARRELRAVEPLLNELIGRHPDAGVGVRPRGPLAFRVAERMSLISDALFLEATRAATGDGDPAAAVAGADAVGRRPPVSAADQAARIAEWISSGRREAFPGLGWLQQPETHSDREWILAVAQAYRNAAGGAAVSRDSLAAATRRP